MAESKYKILVDATVNNDIKKIQSQLDVISKGLKLNVEIKIDTNNLQAQVKNISAQISQAQKQISGTVAGATGKGTPGMFAGLDDFSVSQQGLAKIQTIANDIRKNLGETPIKLDIQGGEQIDDIKRATITYNDLLGNTVKQTYRWHEQLDETGKAIKGSGEWMHVNNQYIDDGIAKEKLRQNEIKQTNKFLSAMGQKADEAVAKTTGKNIDAPEVQRVIEIAGQIKKGIAEGASPEALKQMEKDLKSADKAMSALGKNTMSFSEAMKVALTRIVEWGISTALIYGSLRKIREGVQFVKDLNAELINVRVVTGMTKDETVALAGEYNNLARELGATTLEIAKGSLEWFRQGKTIEQTSELMRSTMILSKLGNLDSAQATELLTATLNGYKLEAEDSIRIVDQLIAVDNEYATSAGEVATALQYSANSAQQVGVGLEELISYITTVSSVTRRSAESIGQSFKTMFARMESIKLGKMFEDDPTTINDVEKALSLVDIQIRDSQNSFRDMGDVLEDVAAKWNTMSETEQSAISGAIAGVRQRENFLVLMNNFTEALEAQDIALRSNGLATERMGTYLEGVEAHANNLATAMEEMWSKTINSDAIINMLDFGTKMVDMINDFGGLIPVLKIVIGLLIAFNANLLYNKILLMSSSISGFGVALKQFATSLTVVMDLVAGGTPLFTALGLVMMSTAAAITMIVSSLVAVGLAWDHFISKTQKEGVSATASAWAETFEKINSYAKSSADVLGAYKGAIESVNQGYKDGGILAELFGKKQEVMEQGLRQVVDSLGNVANGYDEYVAAATEAAEATGYHIDEEGRFYQIVTSSGAAVRVYAEDLQLLSRTVIEVDAAIRNASRIPDDVFTRWFKANPKKRFDELSQSVNTLEDALGELRNLMDTSLTDAFKDFTDEQNNLKNELDELKARMKEALTFPQSEERDAELNRLSSALYETNEAIASTADAYEMATKRILFNMMLQRIGQMDVSENMKTSMINAAYVVGEAWGVLDPTMRATLTTIDSVLNAFLSGTVQEANIASSILSQLEAQALGIAGDYFIDFHVRYTQDNEFAYDANAYGAGIGPQPPQIKPEPFYPNGFGSSSGGGGGGGGGGVATPKEEPTKNISMQSLLSMVISLIKEQKQAEIELFEAQKDAIEQQQDALDEQLDAYNEIIDARKEILQTQREELEYQEEISDHNEIIADLQREIALLSLDNSLEAQARKLELEEDLGDELKDLAKTQRDHAYDEQEKALDAEAELFEKKINVQKELLEEQKKLIDEQIEVIQDFLSKSGLVAQAAMEKMAEKAPSLYEELIAWNNEYGSGIKEDVTDAWDEAYLALKRFKDLVDAIRGGSVPESYGQGSDGTGGTTSNLNWKRQYGIPEGSADWDEAIKLGKDAFLKKHPEYTKKYHTGLEAGPVGDYKTNTGEVFAKLFKGERVVNDRDMASIIKRIPSLAQSMEGNSGRQIAINNLINVEGNVDKNVMPDMQKMAKDVIQQIQYNLIKKGYTRDAKLFSM